MRERGILFSAPMVRALLNGTKTQTRRTVKLPSDTTHVHVDPGGTIYGPGPYVIPTLASGEGHERIRCPYGAPGDRLWVRERWQTAANLDGSNATQIAEKCKDAGWSTPWAPIRYGDGATDNSDVVRDFGGGEWGRKRQGFFMPRWASRITLEVTSVRVERLNEISEDDAKAEGLSAITKDNGRTWKYGIPDRDGLPGSDDVGWDWPDWDVDPRRAYRTLWESINGPGSWELNPFVWVIDFKRVNGEVANG